MRMVTLMAGLAILAGPGTVLLGAAQLQRETINAWQEYIQSADARMQARADGKQPFLWIDESPDRRLRVQRGEILASPVLEHGTKNVPNGLIHDWIGAVFIPNTTLDGLFRVVKDYSRYKEFYKPLVIDSRLLSCADNRQEFIMVWQRHLLFVNAAMEGHYQAHAIAMNAHRGYNFADADQVREIEDFGHASQHLLPPDTGNGYVWRLHSIGRYEERDGGVYLELEALALTRDIPPSLHWLVAPVVSRLSTNSMTTTLRQTRDAVNSQPPSSTGLAMCPNKNGTIAGVKNGGEE